MTSNKIIKCLLIIISYVISFGLICPLLISYKDDIAVLGGLAVLVLTISTFPATIYYVKNLFLTNEKT